MKIWLLTVGEPLPTDKDSPRLHRCGILADMLTKNGEDVTWFTSTFYHQKKTQRYDENHFIQIRERYNLILLHGKAYKSNVSLSRIQNHKQVAYEFSKEAKKLSLPDVILCSYPIIELCKLAVEYGQEHNIPVIIDLRDMWPDIFANLLPSFMRFIVKIVLFKMFRDAKFVCSNATAITGITDEFVNWGIGYSGRERTKKDQAFYLAYPLSKTKKNQNNNYWKELGVEKSKGLGLNICFIGTIGRQFDIETISKVAKSLSEKQVDVKFIICGDGDNLEMYKKMNEGNENVVFPGWINKDQIESLSNLCDLSIAPYHNSIDFKMSIPNKVIEYLSFSLPILSCLEGEVEKLIVENDIGHLYEEKNADSLEEVILEVSKDKKSLIGQSKLARKLFEEKFTTEKVYGKMIKYLKGFASKKA